MSKKSILLIFFILCFANIYIFVRKSNFVYKKQIAYSTLYPTFTDLPVKEIVRVNDSVLSFDLATKSNNPASWVVAINGKTAGTFAAVSPYLTVKKGLNSYALFSKNYTDTIFARIEYIPRQKNGTSLLGLYRTNVSNSTAESVESDKNIFDNINATELKELGQIISDSIRILPGMGTEEKVRRIAVFLNQRIYESAGTPTDSTLALNSFEQYKAAIKGNKIWCGIYASIFNLFAASANIKSRAVELSSLYNNVKGCNYSCNEYFLPEKRQWVAVDIMYNNTCYYNASGKLLNLVEVKNTAVTDSSVKILHVSADTFCIKPFSSMPADFFDLYGREKDLLYIYKSTQQDFNGTLIKRFKNYVLPSYWYLFYSDTNIIDNKNFYIKALLFWLLLGSLILLSVKYLVYFFNKK